MEEQLRYNRQILHDLASRYLEPLPGCFARLVYLASFRQLATGIYEHPELSLVFRKEPVHQALANCHEELFERLLELPLMEQQQEFFQYLEASGQPIPQDKAQRAELFDSWTPPPAPDYLKELFRSNLQALCELHREHNSRARSNR
jgi:hypothetical protein